MTAEETQNPEFLYWLTRHVHGRVLDVGCGDKWYHPFLDAQITSVDGWGFYQPDHLIDLEVGDITGLGQYDIVLLLDVVEHLNKWRGKQIIEQAKTVGAQVIVLTPLGWEANEASVHETGNHYQHHKSLWTVDDFKPLGFRRLHDVASFAPGYNPEPKYVHGAYLGIWP